MDTSTFKRRRKAQPSLGSYNEGDYKWAVYYTGQDGNRARRKFYQKNDAEAFLADKLVEVENLGTRIASVLDDDVKRQAFEASELLKPFGKSILDAAKHFRAHLEATTKSAPITELSQQFQDSKQADGKSSRYLGDLRNRLRPFVRDCGQRFASEVTAKDIYEWLGKLTVGNLTRNHYRLVLSAFFGWCWRLGYCAENPVAKVSHAKVQPTAIEVYTPAEMAALLHSAATWKPDHIRPTVENSGYAISRPHETTDILASIVLCGFAGLRQSEFERLSWEQVKIDRGVIDLSAAITKTAARRLVKIRQPLLAWLQHLGPFQSGRICKTNFSNRLLAFRRQLATPWKQNALRHSFASYLMEALQNPGEVSLQLGHSDAGVVFAHYRETVTVDDAKAFWALTPDAVLADAEVINLDKKALAS